MSNEGLTVKHAIDREPTLAKPAVLSVNIDPMLGEDLFDLSLERAEKLCARLNSWADGETSFTLQCAKNEMYVYDSLTRNIRHVDSKGYMQEIGYGEFSFSTKKARKEQTKYEIKAILRPVGCKDSEIIPFDPNPEVNEQGIKDFLQRYIYKPYTIGENVVGVEVNFNKEFYVPETVEPVDSILAEISDIDKAIANLEKELGL